MTRIESYMSLSNRDTILLTREGETERKDGVLLDGIRRENGTSSYLPILHYSA